MKVLGLDLATRTGFAVGDENSFERKAVQHGLLKIPKRPIFGERLLAFHQSLTELIETHSPDLVAIESVYWPQPKKLKPGEEAEPNRVSAHVLQFLQKIAGIAEMTCCALNVPYEEYAANSWRSTALGVSYAPKGSGPDEIKKMMKRKAKILGYEPQTYDECDAIGILLHALHGAPANKRNQGDLLAMASARI